MRPAYMELDTGRHDSLPYLREGAVLHATAQDGTARRFGIARAAAFTDRDLWLVQTDVEEAAVTTDGRWLLVRTTDDEALVWEFATRRDLCRFLWEQADDDPAALSTLRGLGALRFDPDDAPAEGRDANAGGGGPVAGDADDPDAGRPGPAAVMLVDWRRQAWDDPRGRFSVADGDVVHLVDPAGRGWAVRVEAVEAEAAGDGVRGDGILGQVAVAADGSWLLLCEWLLVCETDAKEPAVEVPAVDVRRFGSRAEVGRWLWGNRDEVGVHTAVLLLFQLGLLQFDPTAGSPGDAGGLPFPPDGERPYLKTTE